MRFVAFYGGFFSFPGKKKMLAAVRKAVAPAEPKKAAEAPKKQAPEATKAPKKQKTAAEPKEAPKKVAPKAAPKKAMPKGAPKKAASSKVIKTGLQSMSNANFKRHAVLAGIKRIRGKEQLYMRCKHLTKALVSDIIKNCVVMMKTSKKNTLTVQMVLFEAQRQGKTVFWTDTNAQPSVHAGNASKKKEAKKEEEADGEDKE